MEENGRGKCPFDPEQRHTSLMTGGELYSGTRSNYLGTESVVQRSPSSMSSELSSSWLYNPTFVASEFVNESESREQDNKVYFFFSETAVEFDFYSRVVVPRVARVCTGDTGGLKKLERKWTTFLKSRLDCSLGGTAFAGLRHVALTRGLRGRPGTVFYALYTDRWGGGAVSAVCSYCVDEVRRVFSGRFKHRGGADRRWAPYAGALPAQRPGDCPLGWDSQTLPSETLTFVSDHPLMDEAVKAEGGRPWLLVPGVAYNRLLVVDMAALDGKSWRTLLLGTDAGALHRAVLPESRGDPHLVEELQALGQQEPVLSMVLTHDQTSVVVAGPSGVVQLPVCRCGRYRACWDCVLARDPCCAWDPQRRLCRRHGGETGAGSWLQDVSGGDATTLCSAHPPDVVAVRVALAPLLLLPCSPPPAWLASPGSETPARPRGSRCPGRACCSARAPPRPPGISRARTCAGPRRAATGASSPAIPCSFRALPPPPRRRPPPPPKPSGSQTGGRRGRTQRRAPRPRQSRRTACPVKTPPRPIPRRGSARGFWSACWRRSCWRRRRSPRRGASSQTPPSRARPARTTSPTRRQRRLEGSLVTRGGGDPSEVSRRGETRMPKRKVGGGGGGGGGADGDCDALASRRSRSET
ncbi:semaphorin-4D-like [Petromyzon marinus]|uniref:semaphorin-4D-like n=1 Tax=Petromyzon marinus TaxID=7757 RepID=UPI003F6EC691